MPNNVDIVVKGVTSEAQESFKGVNKKLKDMQLYLGDVDSLLSKLSGGILGMAGNLLKSSKNQQSKALIYYLITN